MVSSGEHVTVSPTYNTTINASPGMNEEMLSDLVIGKLNEAARRGNRSGLAYVE